MCPHTGIHAAVCCPAGTLHGPLSLVHHYMCVLIVLYVCPHSSICVLILVYMCPHTGIHAAVWQEHYTDLSLVHHLYHHALAVSLNRAVIEP
jgi:hypothetical protein